MRRPLVTNMAVVWYGYAENLAGIVSCEMFRCISTMNVAVMFGDVHNGNHDRTTLSVTDDIYTYNIITMVIGSPSY